jgi:DNA-binding LacI/PurR family transcriptional regulator
VKRPTIADIARRAGMSKGAVSYALHGQPGVSDATRERIMLIAEQVGWNPHTAALRCHRRHDRARAFRCLTGTVALSRA